MLRTTAFTFSLIVIATLSAKPPQQVREERGDFVGSVGCSSSSCHGGAGEKRSQFITWTRLDFHSRAYAVLINARSARIAETLGIAQPTSDARCTVCHSPFQSVSQMRLLPSAHPDEGVSCENCHGAASGWLRGHTRKDWSYATRIGAGMHDLRNLYVRANACVACHQNVEPDLLRAGHPELLFELDGQAEAEPKHWRDDDPWSGARSWLTGQAVALREMSWALTQRPNDDTERMRWNALAWLLAKTVGVETGSAKMNAPVFSPNATDFGEMERTADTLAREAPRWPFDAAMSLRLLRAFAATDAEFVPSADVPAVLLARRAERIVPAIDRLARAARANGETFNIDNELKPLFDDVKRGQQFDAPRFAAHLQALSVALAQRTR